MPHEVLVFKRALIYEKKIVHAPKVFLGAGCFCCPRPRARNADEYLSEESAERRKVNHCLIVSGSL